MTTKRPTSSTDLLPSERQFLTAMQQLGYGRFESLLIHSGELVLDPWPDTVQRVKFGAGNVLSPTPSGTFELKRQVVQLFEYVRAVDTGEIRSLAVLDGLPVWMEIDHSTAGLVDKRAEVAD
jgi:hypothetical protein